MKTPYSFKSHLKYTYGLSSDEYDAMLLRQNNRCGICNVEFTERGIHRVHVDHDHDTGRVRGLLCRGCNVLLHRWVTVESLQAAIRYLESTTPAQVQ